MTTAPFRFIHTADIHLDSPLRSLALRDPAIASLVGGATRQAFANTVQLCLDERVDALLIAGDLYDGDLESMKTALFFVREMQRLTAAGIRVFMIRGNHDTRSKVTRQLNLSLPDGVHVFSGHGGVVEIPETAIAVHGVSFTHPHAPDSLLPRYRPPVTDRVNIGLMHTSLGGAAGHDPYAPCSVQDLAGHGFDYWALGHIHKRSETVVNGCAIVMPGIPQGRHINESGPRSVTLGCITADGQITLAERPVHVAQFERVAVDVSGIDDWNRLLTTIERALQTAFAGITAPHLIARLELAGATPLAYRLQRDSDLVLAETRQMHDAVFVESVALAVARPQEAPARHADPASRNPLTELAAFMSDAADDILAFQALATAELETLRRFLPPELRDHFGSTPDEQAASIARLARQGRQQVLAALEPQQQTEIP
jgi:DNA repair protein SbcD/Mre11